jgi:maltooligosyltrehalose trehalohydrolase
MTIDFSQGAILQPDNSCIFKTWAPLYEAMVLHIVAPKEQRITMKKDAMGFFTAHVKEVDPSAQYFYAPDDGKEFPDPASFFQPNGVHEASALINHSSFEWKDQHWKGIDKPALILYELHVGTFTPEGTFEAIIPRLDDLLDTGINAIEIMPVAQFPGERNWGYDGVFPYAVQHSYGGPEGLKQLVDACHQKGIAVYLDVVYNHIGPEGNYFKEFGPYFTHKYITPWGDAINFDGPWSDGVRDFFSDNVLYWLHHFHIDGLRLDAIHVIYDDSAFNIWGLINQKVKWLEQQTGRTYILIAECDFNNPSVITPIEKNGFGFDMEWLDDFHHIVYALLDKEGQVLYEDFYTLEQAAKAINEGFIYTGEYVKARKRKFGASSKGVPGDKFVIFNQNHDQIGNRADGARLSKLINQKSIQLATALMFLSPYIPLLFMGEEYSETAPFLYFVDHSEPALIKAVRDGRKREFAHFYNGQDPIDPQAATTFENSKLHWHLRQEPSHKMMLEWYKSLIQLRKTNPALQTFDKAFVQAYVIHEKILTMHRQSPDGIDYLFAVFNFSTDLLSFELPVDKHLWTMLLSNNEAYTTMMQTNAGARLELEGHGMMLFSGT